MLSLLFLYGTLVSSPNVLGQVSGAARNSEPAIGGHACVVKGDEFVDVF